MGHSAVFFGGAVRNDDGKRCVSIELSPEMAAVMTWLGNITGLFEHIRIIVDRSHEVLAKIFQEQNEINEVQIMFISHEKEAYVSDLSLNGELGTVLTGELILVTVNVIYLGEPEYIH